MAAIERMPLIASGKQIDPSDLLQYQQQGYGSQDFANSYDLVLREIVSANTALTSGQLMVLYFTAGVNFTATNIVYHVGTVKAGGTTSIAKQALYALDTDNLTLLTLLASTTNDTTYFDSTGSHVKALSSTVSLVRGTRYAAAFLGVASVAWTTAPNMRMITTNSAANGLTPVMSRTISGLTDLPALPATPGGATGSMLYARLT